MKKNSGENELSVTFFLVGPLLLCGDDVDLCALKFSLWRLRDLDLVVFSEPTELLPAQGECSVIESWVGLSAS